MRQTMRQTGQQPTVPAPSSRSRARRPGRDEDIGPAQLRRLLGLVDHDPAGDPFPVVGMDAVVLVVGNATQALHFYTAALGMDLVAYRGPQTGVADHVSYVLRSGSARFVLHGAVSPSSSLIEHHRRHGDGVVDLALEVLDVDACIDHARSQGAEILDEPHDERRRVRHGPAGGARHLRADPSHAGRPLPVPGPLPARLRGSLIGVPSPPGCAAAAVPGHRPLRGQRRAGPDGPVGGLLPPGDGLLEPGGVHRRRHRHRVLGADEQGGGERQPPGEVPAERTGGLPSDLPDRGVPALLQRPGCAAPRAGHERHLRQRGRHAERGRGVPRDPGRLLRRPRAAAADRARPGADRGAEGARHPRRPGRGRLPPADLHHAGGRSPDPVLRADRAARIARVRQGQLQGPVRVDRAGAGPCEATSRPLPSSV